METLIDWQRPATTSESSDEAKRSNIAKRQVRKRQLLVASLAGSVVAATVIAIGLPNVGIAIYITATLPFALFP